MTDVTRLFAYITAILEDMHGVAVEGQANDLPPAMTIGLASSLRTDTMRLVQTLALIDNKSALP